MFWKKLWVFFIFFFILKNLGIFSGMRGNKLKSILVLYRNIQVSDKAEGKFSLSLQCLSIQVQNPSNKIVFPLSSTIFDLNIDLYVLTYSCTLKNRHCWVGNMKIIFHLLLYFLLVSWGRIGRLINHPSPASLTSSVLASFRCLLQTTQTNFQVRVNPASCGFPHVSSQSCHTFSAKGYQPEIKEVRVENLM